MFEEAMKAYEKDRTIRSQEFDLKSLDHNEKVAELR